MSLKPILSIWQICVFTLKSVAETSYFRQRIVQDVARHMHINYKLCEHSSTEVCH